jgi:ubiquinone/menaquinone biosynthesis C-methylase UbiE
MVRYVIRGGQAGFERLQALAEMRLPETSNLLDRVDMAPGWNCLDLGCGSGDITFEMARRVGPIGRVTGFDMDATKLALAKVAAAERGLDNVDFVEANLDDWSPNPDWDMVYCGLVFQHLPDPLGLLRRMAEAVRPGGVVVVEDADFDGLFCFPSNRGFDFYADSYREALRRRGGDPSVGRKLYQLFTEAGLGSPSLKVVQPANVTGPGKWMAHSTLAATAESILAEGIASRDAVDAALADLADFTADPNSLVGEPRIFQVWARVGKLAAAG